MLRFVTERATSRAAAVDASSSRSFLCGSSPSPLLSAHVFRRETSSMMVQGKRGGEGRLEIDLINGRDKDGCGTRERWLLPGSTLFNAVQRAASYRPSLTGWSAFSVSISCLA